VTLTETQARVHEAITSGAELARVRIEGCVADTPVLSARESLEIYANMYLCRLVRALQETFPNLARHLGDESFASLAERYLRRHPSEHHDVGQVGRLLPNFLRQNPDPERPWLRDLAELEWARNEIFFAPAPRSVAAGALAAIPLESADRARLVLSPAMQVLVLEHAVTSFWEASADGNHPAPPKAGRSPAAVWRSGFQVHHCPLQADEALALEMARHGESLGRVCATFADREDPSAAASGAIASWFAEGWVVGVESAGIERT